MQLQTGRCHTLKIEKCCCSIKMGSEEIQYDSVFSFTKIKTFLRPHP